MELNPFTKAEEEPFSLDELARGRVIQVSLRHYSAWKSLVLWIQTILQDLHEGHSIHNGNDIRLYLLKGVYMRLLFFRLCICLLRSRLQRTDSEENG